MRCDALNDLRLARLRQRISKLVAGASGKRKPLVIKQLVEACVQIVTHREKFPELGSGKGQRRFVFGQRNYERHLRRLEAMALVQAAMFSHMDLVSRRVGKRRHNGSFDAVRTYNDFEQKGRRPPKRRDGQTSLQKETGLGRTALCSALRDLRQAEWLTSEQPIIGYDEDETGKPQRYRGCASVHQITLKCIQRLGVDLKWFETEGQKAKKRAEEGPTPLYDVRRAREHDRMVRAQRIAAKRVSAPRPTEAEAAAAIRRFAARQRGKEDR